MADDTTPGPDLRERIAAVFAHHNSDSSPSLNCYDPTHRRDLGLADAILAVVQPELDQVLVDLETAKGWRDAALTERDTARAEAAEYRIANTRLQELITLRTEERDRLKAAVARMRALHVNEYGSCAACMDVRSVAWPCPTIAALDHPGEMPVPLRLREPSETELAAVREFAATHDPRQEPT